MYEIVDVNWIFILRFSPQMYRKCKISNEWKKWWVAEFFNKFLAYTTGITVKGSCLLYWLTNLKLNVGNLQENSTNCCLILLWKWIIIQKWAIQAKKEISANFLFNKKMFQTTLFNLLYLLKLQFKLFFLKLKKKLFSQSILYELLSSNRARSQTLTYGEGEGRGTEIWGRAMIFLTVN